MSREPLREVMRRQGGFCTCCKSLVSWRKAYLSTDGRGVCITCKSAELNARHERADCHDRPSGI